MKTLTLNKVTIWTESEMGPSRTQGKWGRAETKAFLKEHPDLDLPRGRVDIMVDKLPGGIVNILDVYGPGDWT